MKHTDLWTGIFWILVGVAVCVQSLGYGVGQLSVPGPGFLPLVAGGTLICLSLLLILVNIKAKGSDSPTEKLFAGILWKRWGITLASLLAYALFMESLGFILCTLLFIFILMISVQPKRWLLAAGVALVTTLASYLVFQTWLKTQLPTGFLGI